LAKYSEQEKCCLQLFFSGKGNDSLLDAIEALKSEYVVRQAKALDLIIRGVSNWTKGNQHIRTVHIHGDSKKIFELLACGASDKIFFCGGVHVATVEELTMFSTLPHYLLLSSDKNQEAASNRRTRSKSLKLGGANLEYATLRVELPVDSGMYASGLSVIGTLIGVSTISGVMMAGRRLKDEPSIVEFVFMFLPGKRKQLEQFVSHYEIALTWNVLRKQILPFSKWSRVLADFMAVEQIETITQFCRSTVAELQEQAQ
jgi:hypothetical protein